MAVNSRFSTYEPRTGGSTKKKNEEGLQPVTPVYSTQGAVQPVPTTAEPTKPVYQTNSMAFPTYTSPTTGKQYTYSAAAPTWQWDDSARPGDWQWNEAKPEWNWNEEKPTYTNQYQDQINSMVNDILNRDKFSYDYTTDPLYKMYADAYTRNGQQAMKDTYAQMAARTGGLGSSYAGTAAQTQYNQYMNALNDKVPELYKLAYSMYQDEGNTMRNNLGMIQGLENTDYGRYMDTLGQWNTDRNFNYGQYQDALGQWNTDRNFNYGQYQDDWDRYYNDRNFSYGQYSDDWDRWNTNRNWDYNLWQDNLDRQEEAAKAAYNNQVAAYNAKQKQVDSYNAAQQAAYDAALKKYQQDNNKTTPAKANNSYDSNPNATIKAVQNSGSSPVVEFYGVTYNLSQNGQNGLNALVERINNMPFSAEKKQQLMKDIQKYGV